MIVYNINKNISEVYLGDNSISEVYIGVNKVFPSEEPPTPVFGGKYKFTLNDSSIVSADCDATSAITTAETSAYTNTLVQVEIGDCVEYIGEYSFSNYGGLTSATIGSGVIGINTYAFYGCSNLISVTIGGVDTIGDYAFYGCSSLASITLPANIRFITKWAFRDCTSMNNITCLATTPPRLGTDALKNTNNCPIYVPAESVETYKTALGWSTYASRIQPIS